MEKKMKQLSKLWITIVILILASLACKLAGGIPTSNPISQIGTTIASTLTALGPILPQASTEIPPVDAIPTPAPTEPPLPSILRVAYLKDGNAWVWSDGGGTLQLTTSGDVQDVRISSDGQVIAYLRNIASFNDELWAINNDGNNSRLLVSAADFMATYAGTAGDPPSGISAFQFDWQPGSHNLYFNTKPLYEGPGSFGYNDLQLVNADSLEKTTLFSTGNGGEFFFSPDGNQVALVTPTNISLANSDGTNLRLNILTYPAVITYSEYMYYPQPIWSSDSSELRVVIPPEDPKVIPLIPSGLWLIPTDGNMAINTGGILAIPYAWPDNAISPDLNRVGYAQSVGDPPDNMREIHLARTNGRADFWYMRGESAQFLGWLPNSHQYVFSVESGPDIGTHVSSLAEGYTTLSADPASIGNISWTDDTHYLHIWRTGVSMELRYGVLGGGSSLLDSGQIWGYDFSQ